MSSDWRSKRVVVVAGSGGVGKTTVSAALAAAFAEQGENTVVLTVDPARRLAQALGLDGLSQDLQTVPLGAGAKGTLRASMLDSRRYFDRVVERFATSPEQRDRVVNHPLWKLTIEYLGGTQEYAAMERILEFVSDPTITKIIVDTPPTQNALDLFAAPERLASFLESSVLKWFRGSSGGGFGFDLLRRGSRIAMGVLQKVLGGDFLDRLGDFLRQLDGMERGFRERHRAVLELLRSDSTSFVLVSHPNESRYAESRSFGEALRGMGIVLPCVVLNRVEPAVPPAVVADHASAADRGNAEAVVAFLRSVSDAEAAWVQRFADLRGDAELLTIPRHDTPPQTVADLSELGRTLLH